MKNNILLDGVNYQLETTTDAFDVTGSVKVFIVNKDVKDLKFNMTDSSTLEIINFSEIASDTKIEINMHNNSTFKYVSNIDVSASYKLNILLNMLGNNSLSDIEISGVVSGCTNISVNSFDEVGTIDNVIDENIRLLNDGGKVHVEPILRVGSRNVIANHSNSITDVNPDYLFYLKTKGITEEVARKIIIDSYKYGLVSKYEELKNIKK